MQNTTFLITILLSIPFTHYSFSQSETIDFDSTDGTILRVTTDDIKVIISASNLTYKRGIAKFKSRIFKITEVTSTNVKNPLLHTYWGQISSSRTDFQREVRAKSSRININQNTNLKR